MMEAMGIKGQPMGRKNLKPQAEIFKKDLKYIYCGVCRKMVDIALDKSTELLAKRFQFKKKRKNEATEFDGEGAVQEYVEKMWCAAGPLASLPPRRSALPRGSRGPVARLARAAAGRAKALATAPCLAATR